ncbi:hypothetical protein [Thiohalocapsa marina]|uniref:hypothetical protein n=1 Tax=Thiohalocapsa marina TaxID=424902 RepID=UPI0036DD1ACD
MTARSTHPSQGSLFTGADLSAMGRPITTLMTDSEQISTLRRRLMRAEAQLSDRTDQLAAHAAAIAKLEAANSRLETINRRLRAGQNGPTGIPKTTWRLLMQLVHPDKHGGSQAALTATQWLNANRP